MALIRLIKSVAKALTGKKGLSELEVMEARPKRYQQKLVDGGGLHLLVHSDGLKEWAMDYYFEGKKMTLPIGEYPDVTLTSARFRRDQAINDLAKGLIP